jgi:hypothetical protein
VFHQLPLEFCLFFDHCCLLSFDGRPDYDLFHHTFSDLLVREGFQDDLVFDWEVARDQSPGQALRPRNRPDGTWRCKRCKGWVPTYLYHNLSLTTTCTQVALQDWKKLVAPFFTRCFQVRPVVIVYCFTDPLLSSMRPCCVFSYPFVLCYLPFYAIGQ